MINLTPTLVPRTLRLDRLTSIATDSHGARVEPLTVALAKQQQRITSTSEDALVAIWIAAARAAFEQATGRQTITASWELQMYDPICGTILELPRPPLLSVESIGYTDAGGVAQVFDPSLYTVTPSIAVPPDPATLDPFCPPGRITLAAGAAWPTGPLVIARTCGYGDTPEAMPPILTAALCLFVGNLYAHREAVTSVTLTAIPLGLEPMCQAFKWTAFDAGRQGVTSSTPDAIPMPWGGR